MMIYRNPEIPSTYNRIAELHDNYIVWVSQSSLVGTTNYRAWVQYLSPDYCFEVVNFRPSYANFSSITYTYDNGSLSSARSTNNLITINPEADYIVSDKMSRADYPQIFVCSFILIVCFIWILNQLTKFVKKGGIFGSR